MKDRIGKIAKALGITPQAIHLYEERGILRFSRQEENGYRIFGRRELRLLMRTRILRSYGFSVSDIARIFNDLDGEEVLEQYRLRQEELTREIAELQRTRERLARLERESREAMERAGTCLLGESEPCWVCPFMEGNMENHELDIEVVRQLSQYNPLRWDASLIGAEEMYGDAMAYRPVIVMEDISTLPPQLQERTIYRPAQPTLHAWMFREKSSDVPPQLHLRFALDELERRGLRLSGEALLWPVALLRRSTDQQVYFYVQLPVEPKDGEFCRTS